MRRDGLTRKALPAALVALVCALAVPALAQERSYTLVSGGPGFVDPDGFSSSLDGATVAFSTTEALLPSDTDDKRDVYLRRGGSLILASQGDGADPVPQNTSGPTVSQDGSRVFFTTNEKLQIDDDDAATDVYVWTGDRAQLVSRRAPAQPESEAPATLAPRVPAPTADRVIISTAAPLTADDTDDGAVDLYEVGWNPRLLTPGTAKDVGSLSANPALTHVTFSASDDLLPTDTDSGGTDTYLTEGGAYTHLSNGQGSAAPNYIDFESTDGLRFLDITAQALLATDTDGDGIDVYLLNRAGEVRLLSTASGASCPATACRADAYAAADDLSRIAFTTDEKLLPSDSDASVDLYVWANDQLEHASLGAGTAGNGAADVVRLVGGRDDRMTADGRGVIFATSEKLVPEDVDTALDLYERRDGTTRVVSRGELDSSAPVEPPETGVYRNGERILFTTAGALSRTDTDGRLDIYLRENGAAAALVTPGKEAFDAEFQGASSDTAAIFFRTRERLAGDDRDEALDIFEARRAPQTVTPVPDTTPPELALRLTRSRFRASSKTARIATAAAKRRKRKRRTPIGTTIELTLGEAALVNFEVQRLSTGRVSKGRCVKATRKLRSKKKCALVARVAGRLSASRAAGLTRIAFYGRLPGGKRLSSGRYRLNARAHDAAGNASAVRQVPFTVVRR
jgi:Tol biopolymer transport system component